MNDSERAARLARSQQLADLTAAGHADLVTVMNTVDPRLVAGLTALEPLRRAQLVAQLIGVDYGEVASLTFHKTAAAELALLCVARAEGPGRIATVALPDGDRDMFVTKATIGGMPGVDMARGGGRLAFPTEILAPRRRLAVRPPAVKLTPSEVPPTAADLLKASYERKELVPLDRLYATTELAALLRLGGPQDARRIVGVDEFADGQLLALALLGGRPTRHAATTARVEQLPGLGGDPLARVFVLEDGDVLYHRLPDAGAR